MNIVMIGSGNMATFLAHRLVEHEHQIIQVYSRDITRAQELANRVSAQAINDLNQLIEKADLYILAVKDDLLSPLLLELKNKNGCFIFLSGSVAFNDLLAHQPQLACLWCMYSIQKNQLPTDRNIPVFIQYQDSITEHNVRTLASCISDEVKVVSDDEKSNLHLAAVFSNNFTNHMVAIAQELLKERGLNENWILPILEQTVTKIKNQNAKENQTGPALRQDKEILAKQTELLRSTPDWQKVYEAVSSSIDAMYRKNK